MCLSVSRSTYHAQIHRRAAHARGSSAARRPNPARAARLRRGSAGSRYDRPLMRSTTCVQYRLGCPCSGSGARTTSLQRHGSASAGVSVRAAKIDRHARLPARPDAGTWLHVHITWYTVLAAPAPVLQRANLPRCHVENLIRRRCQIRAGECASNPASASARGAVEIIFYICVALCCADGNTTRTPAESLPRFLHPVP